MASSTSLDSAVGDWRISFIFAVPDLNRSVKDDEASFNLSILVPDLNRSDRTLGFVWLVV